MDKVINLDCEAAESLLKGLDVVNTLTFRYMKDLKKAYEFGDALGNDDDFIQGMNKIVNGLSSGFNGVEEAFQGSKEVAEVVVVKYGKTVSEIVSETTKIVGKILSWG